MEDAVTHGSIIFHLLQLQLVDFLGWLGTRVSDIGRIQNAFKMIPFEVASGLGTARKVWWTDERHQIFMMFLVSLVESFQSSQLPEASPK